MVLSQKADVATVTTADDLSGLGGSALQIEACPNKAVIIRQ